jgi:sulfur-oxidizing protein SoxY
MRGVEAVIGSAVTRRTFGTGLLALVAVRPAAASDLPADVVAAIRTAIGDGAPTDGGIALQLPAVAENGAQVPLTVTVEGTPSRERHVRAIHLFATRNPTPGIASYTLGPAVGRAQVATRVRLAEGQRVLAYAVWSDGTVNRTAAETVVTVGGCVT